MPCPSSSSSVVRLFRARARIEIRNQPATRRFSVFMSFTATIHARRRQNNENLLHNTLYHYVIQRHARATAVCMLYVVVGGKALHKAVVVSRKGCCRWNDGSSKERMFMCCYEKDRNTVYIHRGAVHAKIVHRASAADNANVVAREPARPHA